MEKEGVWKNFLLPKDFNRKTYFKTLITVAYFYMTRDSLLKQFLLKSIQATFFKKAAKNKLSDKNKLNVQLMEIFIKTDH